MTYLATIERSESRPLTPAPPPATEEGFAPLEWSVIDLARNDRLWTIRTGGRLRSAWNWLVGRANPKLANPRLEALRRMAVLTWHFGFTVPGDDVADFLSAGFSLEQYELLAGTINSALAAPRRISS